MKLKLQTIITCLLLLISFTAKSQYDITEVGKLRAFLDLPNGATTNGLKISAGYLSSNPGTWVGITWDGGSPTQKISKIDFNTKSLTGTIDLSNFSSLNYVNLSSNQLTDVNVAGSTALTNLYCGYNQISNLNVSANINLDTLCCDNNQLTSLDVTKLTSAKFINCSDNKITSLDIAQNTALTNLYCGYNQISNLDVSANINLDTLCCDSNQLTSLDVTKLTSAKFINCSDNKITSLDIAQNTALTNLYCGYNQISNLDVSANINLDTLCCDSNQLTSLDVTKLTSAKFINCSSNKITSLDITQNTALTNLYCSYNQISNLDVSANINLDTFYCDNNELKFSDIKHSSTVTDSILSLQRPFIPLGVVTTGGTMAAATGGTIDLTKETNINAVIGNTANITTFHVWKKAWNGTISDVTDQCSITTGGTGVGGFITLPPTAGEKDSLFITMSNPTYPDFVEQTTPATALSSGMRTRIFALVGSTFLPIELLSFTANLNTNKVDLAWSTASEKNNAFFTVERSVNNKNWESVAKVDGAGNSNTQLNYSTIDENPLSGVSYYRLKQTDFDGKFEYSKTVVINRNVKTTIQLYPNPANNEISVTGNEEDISSVKIYNSLGQDVTKFTNYSSSNTKQKQIDISKLTTGIYILTTKNTTNKLIVK